MIERFTIGSDPELFLKKEIDGVFEYFPAITVINGNKEEPYPIDDKGRAILVDNVMLEFNTLPSSNIIDFVKEHLYFLVYLKNEMAAKQCVISKKSFVEFHPRFLNNESAKEFGCDPDFNAHTLKENIAPNAEQNYRSAAGHIHIGYKDSNLEKSVYLVRLLDLTVGLQSLLDDTDTKRRTLYGKAGAFREKDFGLEYRTLSNYWIFDEKHMQSVYRGVEKAFELYNSGFRVEGHLQNDVVRAINTYNKALAIKLINKHLK